MHHPTDRITHTTAFVTPVVDHWLEQEIAQWVHHEGSIGQPNLTTNAPLNKVHVVDVYLGADKQTFVVFPL